MLKATVNEQIYWGVPTPTKPTVICSDTAELWLKVPQYLSIWVYKSCV